MTYPIQITEKKMNKSEKSLRDLRENVRYAMGQHMCNRNEPQKREKTHIKNYLPISSLNSL